MFELQDRVVLLTGAAGHLGAAMARGLARAGAHVVLNGRSAEKLALLADELTVAGGRASVAAFDVLDEAAAAEAIAALGQAHGRLDVLINNAYAGKVGTLATATAADFEQAYAVTVTAAFRLLSLATPWLALAGVRNPGGASVINVSSMYGSVSPDPSIYGSSGANNPPFYGAAKAGLQQLTRYAACHLAQQRIRVNTLSPGPFPAAAIAQTNPAFHAELCRKNPMGRIGAPDELVGPVLFLASDASSYVTGINLPVDGGWTAW